MEGIFTIAKAEAMAHPKYHPKLILIILAP